MGKQKPGRGQRRASMSSEVFERPIDITQEVTKGGPCKKTQANGDKKIILKDVTKICFHRKSSKTTLHCQNRNLLAVAKGGM